MGFLSFVKTKPHTSEHNFSLKERSYGSMLVFQCGECLCFCLWNSARGSHHCSDHVTVDPESDEKDRTFFCAVPKKEIHAYRSPSCLFTTAKASACHLDLSRVL